MADKRHSTTDPSCRGAGSRSGLPRRTWLDREPTTIHTIRPGPMEAPRSAGTTRPARFRLLREVRSLGAQYFAAPIGRIGRTCRSTASLPEQNKHPYTHTHKNTHRLGLQVQGLREKGTSECAASTTQPPNLTSRRK
ncbi:unnamed protein product [Protopolystoma xenopodis]|uniref:Uncharacterized protein n=1 Tax=Protopolystoma xenopodis TaxID=117903 RepID=A0A448XF63_9PLAT|nr:unnamed protein product [Protopolystoma xenopodis]